MKYLLTIFLCLSATLSRAQTDTIKKDITYQTIDGIPIRLDVAIPKDQGPGPFPLVVCFHGGAFRIGDKSKFTPMIDMLAQHGYVAASINYRFSPKYRWPAQLEDGRIAIHFLKSHAADYRIDVDRLGTTGESAGSQLAMLLAFEPDAPGTTPLNSTRARAVVNYYGPVDLCHLEIAPFVDFMWQQRFHETMESAIADFLGSKDPTSPRYKAASPITYIDDCTPPVLTFHGTLDPVVPYHQAEELHATLRKCGVAEELVPIPNGLHGAWASDVKLEADHKALAFFDSYLKPGPVKKDLHSGAISAASHTEKPGTAVR